MIVDYILTATGSISDPRIQVILYDETEDSARKSAAQIVKKLAVAGYFRFDLYSVGEGDNHVNIARFRAMMQEPEVIII
jgi:ABC-type arginine transport system ATPase subunit